MVYQCVGKTYFANTFKDAIMLNTDGNIKYVDSPYIAVKDEVVMNGRIKNTKLAWDTFKEAVDDILAGEHDYKTVIVDLVEDIYEACRISVYKKLGIDHETDAGYGKGYDIVKTEFFPTIRKLLNSEYNVILLSHEKQQEVKKKNGSTITIIRPNIGEGFALKLAGMVDLTARAIHTEEGRFLRFPNDSETEFGGSRIKVKEEQINLDIKEFTSVFTSAVKGDK